MSNATSADHISWAINPYSWDESTRVAQSLGLPLVAGMVLAGRGLGDPQDARVFFECSQPLPDPFLFGHMEAAVQTLAEAVEAGRRVVIHGDYDADGITATALLVLGLRDLGVAAEWYLPSRFNEGYGLSRTAVEAIAEAGPALLITVDCGVNYPAEVELAKQRGLDVIVVDHHRPGPVLPDCSLIHEVVGDYPHGDLCGVGLALKLLHALHIRRLGAVHSAMPEALHGLLDLVAIGTIADLAPLRGENRFYVKEGLKLLTIGQRVGLRELAAVAACSGTIDSGSVAFRLAPRLNAAGRLADPSPPLRLLLTDDADEARKLAAKLHELNGARQDVERQILAEAVEQVESLGELPPALVLAGSEWHEGVVGIVASRLVERYNRPTVLLGMREGIAKGSGRSISAYDLMGALNACSRFMTVYGGHRQAVGLTLPAEQVDGFRAAMEEHARITLDGRELVSVYHADAVLRGEDLNADVAAALDALAPFGSGNPKPRLLVVDGSVERAEATRNGAHVRCTIDVDGVKVRGIGFGLGGIAESLQDDGSRRTLGVQFRINEWQGVLRPELMVERIGPGSENPLTVTCGPSCVKATVVTSVEARNLPAAEVPPDTATLRAVHGRDLRDRPGRASALAQVLGSEERMLMFTVSIPHALSDLARHLPLDALCGGALECVGRGCSQRVGVSTEAARVALIEWGVPADVFAPVGAGTHVVVLDPPFRSAHVALVRAAEDRGAMIHLYYGVEQRQLTSSLLRYLVHPRFAMVCAFRALQQGQASHEELVARAACIAWDEAHVVLARGDLDRAMAILDDLGDGRGSQGEAKLDVRNSPAYVAAESDYEECARLCQTL